MNSAGVVSTVAEREALLAGAERAAQLGTWTWDLASNEVAWSQELFRILGYDPAVDRPSTEAFFAAVHPDDRERVRETSASCVETGRTYPIEYRLLRASGAEREVLMDGIGIFDKGGRPSRFVGTILDLTDRRAAERERNHLEAELRQAQKMEAIGRLAGGVAHDFNNLLTIVMVNAQILLREGPRDEIQQIVDAVGCAAELTRRLLLFSRRATVEPVVLDINDVLEGAVKLISRIIGEDVAVTLDLSRTIGKIRADQSQLHQVLLNLVVNARDAMPRGGELMIRTATSEAPGGAPGEHVRVEVSDTGVGMDEHTRSRIFEPFFTTKDPEKGTGLGLSTVFGIVQKAGGVIEVASQLGVGTTFKLYFPVIEEKLAEGASLRALAESRRGDETILVVEDNAEVSMLMTGVLRRAGYVVHRAGRPSEAIRFFRQHAAEIALVVTDVVMPEGSGPELVRWLRARAASLRVLYVTGYDPGSGLVEASLDGPTLAKPFTPEVLLAKVREALSADLPEAPRDPVHDRPSG